MAHSTDSIFLCENNNASSVTALKVPNKQLTRSWRVIVDVCCEPSFICSWKFAQGLFAHGDQKSRSDPNSFVNWMLNHPLESRLRRVGRGAELDFQSSRHRAWLLYKKKKNWC